VTLAHIVAPAQYLGLGLQGLGQTLPGPVFDRPAEKRLVVYFSHIDFAVDVNCELVSPRKLLVDDEHPGCYHLISRCVRRAFLCGKGYDHRRDHLAAAVEAMAGAFSVEVCAFAAMANHFHLVVRVDPLSPLLRWSDREVVERWAEVFPLRDGAGNPLPAGEEELQRRERDPLHVARARERLGSLSWFMKVIKERVARRANREDGCTGAFWEGRFGSVRLLDQGALVAAMAYVDLNPIRAGIADRPETSPYTAVRERIRARQAAARALRLHAEQPRLAPALLRAEGLPGDPDPDPERDLWVAPLRRCMAEGPGYCTPLSVDDYLALVDETGRQIRRGKRGAIPARLAPILERLELDVAGWVTAMSEPGRLLGTAIGSVAARAAEAARRGTRWVVDKFRAYRPEPG